MAGKKDIILDTALRLFSQSGLQGASTANIAKQAGVATGTLFHYFSTKEELIRQLFLRLKEEFKQATAQGLDGESTTRGKLRRIWFNAIAWGIDHPEAANFFAQLRITPYRRLIPEGDATMAAQAVRAVVEEGIRQEIFKSAPQELLRALWGGGVLSATDYFRQNPQLLYDPEHVELVFSMFWDLLRR